MRLAVAFAALAFVATGAAAKPPPVGRYQVAEGPDVGVGLELTSDGRFAYFLAAGALDERATGRWAVRGEAICLTTEPTPVRPAFALAPRGPVGPDAPTLLVTWPNGRGIAGVNFTIGFAAGDPAADYTQEDGWTLPAGETRRPEWIELVEPIHDVAPPRYPLNAADRGTIVVVLTPNDLGTVDFRGACLERAGKAFVLNRKGGQMRLVKINQ